MTEIKEYQLLQEHHQEHVLQYYESLSELEKKNLLKEVQTIDWNDMDALYSEKDATAIEMKNITPIVAIKKEEIEQDKYKEIGKQIIANHQLAICSMAGGQGTRLGFDGPKGTYMLPLQPPISIFETIAKKVRDAYTEYGVLLYWYIMTSSQNHEATVQFFEENSYFGYDRYHVIFFQQGELPLLDMQGKVVLKDKANIFMAPDGNGGIFKALGDKKIIQHMKAHGIRYLAIGNVDNILINMIDPIMVGLMEEKHQELASKSFLKPSPEGKWGVFCKSDNKPMVIEYTETPRDLLEARNEEGELIYGEAHFGCNYFHVNLLERIVNEKLPMHTACKKNKGLNTQGETVEMDTYKFESFIFDAFQKAKDILVLRVKQEEEFAPIKNKEGNESPETALALYKQFYHLS